MSETWDLAIVGAGAAGLPAAICAARKGASVLLLEADDRIGGTLHISSGSMGAGGVKRWTAEVLDDSGEAHFADGLRQSQGTAHAELLKLWTDQAGPALDWLIDNGVEFDSRQPTQGGAHEDQSVPRVYTPVGLGPGIVRALEPALQALIASGQIDLRLSTRMTRLVRNADGAVAGLVAEGADGADVVFQAENIVLATGGYSHNDALWKELHDAPRRVYALPHIRGDGFVAATALGAKIDYAQYHVATFGASQDIDDLSKFWLHSTFSPKRRPAWEIFVNLKGERFMPEDLASPDGREHALRSQPDQSFWVIYDERIRREAPPLFFWDEAKLARAFAESDNFQAAETLEGLAQRCGLDPARLIETVDAYNSGQRAQSDGLGRKHMPTPIGHGPFYAVRHFGTSAATWGGIVTDGDLRILGSDGAPIPNLYAAGEILGMGVFGKSAMGGVMVSSSIAFGKLLGERLAKGVPEL